MSKIELTVCDAIPVTPPPKKYTLTLHMNADEAAALKAIAGCVGGTGEYRKLVDGIYDALHKAEVGSFRIVHNQYSIEVNESERTKY